MVVRREAIEARSEERPFCQVEWAPALLDQPFLHSAEAQPLRARLEIENRQTEMPVRCHDLDRLAIHLREDRAKRFMAMDDLAEAALERRHVEQTPHPHTACDVVCEASGLETVDEPQPFLCEGQGRLQRI